MSIESTIAIDEDTTMSTRTITIDESEFLPMSKQFYFAMTSREEVGNESWFTLVEKEFYDTHGYIDDQHILDIVLANVTNPTEFENEFFEECESQFQAGTMNRKETLAYLKAQPNFTKKRL